MGRAELDIGEGVMVLRPKTHRQAVLEAFPKARLHHRPEASILERYVVRNGLVTMGTGASPQLAWIRSKAWIAPST